MRKKKIAVQTTDDDDETFEPHAGVDAHEDEVNDEDVVPAPARKVAAKARAKSSHPQCR
jgi:hypothetical protein